MNAELVDIIRVATGAVRAAAKACVAVQKNLVTEDSLQKKDRSPVTVADYACQAVVCKMLSESLGDVSIVGEEDSGELRLEKSAAVRANVTRHVQGIMGNEFTESDVLEAIDRGGAKGGASGSFWTLDPIDGTKGFLRGEQYAIALALLREGRPVLGILGCPNLTIAGKDGRGLLMTAVSGEGTMMSSLLDDEPGTAVKVSDITQPQDARFCESVESAHSDQSSSMKIAEILGITQEPFRIDSQCKYAAVARGDAQIYLRLPTSADYREKIWDHAAGMLCVEAAGGKVTDIRGRALDFSLGRKLENNQGIIATSGSIHADVVAAVGKVLDLG